MPSPSPFGKRLREARNLRRLTQDQLAQRSRVPAAMISHFETGERSSASADTLVKLANALKVSVDYLLSRTDDPAPRGGRVEAAFRKLSTASDERIEAALKMLEALGEHERDEGKR